MGFWPGSEAHEKIKPLQRKKNSLVPIGEAISGLGGPVKALREASPQAVHHFTQADQVNQLVGASEADPDLGFMARTMALCSLPRSNPGNCLQYERVNGPFTLYMTATAGNKLPFGNIPRLLMAWLTTEAVRTRSRELVLGRSLAGFMRALGIYHNSGGRGGVQTRLRNQMKRLFGCTVSLIYADENVDATVNAVIADRTVLWGVCSKIFGCLWGVCSWITARIHSDLWITPKTLSQRPSEASAALGGGKRVSRPAFVAPGRVNGPSCGTGGISGTTDWRCPVARAG